jgi:hypothetical protein
MNFPPGLNIGPPFYRFAPQENTTKKNATFLSAPLQDSALRDVPGVGDVAFARLSEAGIESAEQLMGHFLISKRNPATMTHWLTSSGVRAQEAGKIAAALERKARATVSI